MKLKMSSSSSAAMSTAVTALAAIAAGAAVSATFSIFMRIGWSKTPPSVKMDIANKSRNLKKTVSSSSLSFRDKLARAYHNHMPSHSPRHGNGKDRDDDEEATLKDPFTVFSSLQGMLHRASDTDRSHDRETDADDWKQLASVVPPHRLYLSFMTLLHVLQGVNKREPDIREDLFSGDHGKHSNNNNNNNSEQKGTSATEDWVDEEELERVVSYLDFCHWADCLERGDLVQSGGSKHHHNHHHYQTSSENDTIHMLNLPAILQPLGFKLLRKATSDDFVGPSLSSCRRRRFGHFVAVHHGRKEVVLAIGSSMPSSLPSKSRRPKRTHTSVCTERINDITSSVLENQISNHSFYGTAAKLLWEDVGHLVDHFFVPCGYRLVICGHSVSAGVASLLGVILKARHPLSKVLSKRKLALQVYAFGPPPCLSISSSIATQDYITSIVNNNDCVPRITVANLKQILNLLTLLDEKLKQWALWPKDLRSAHKQLAEMRKMNPRLFLTTKETNDFHQPNGCSIDKNDSNGNSSVSFGVPGRIILIWNHTQDATIIGAKAYTVPTCVLKSSSLSPAPIPHHPALERLMIDETMLFDHNYEAYRNNLEVLMEQTANTI